MQKIKKRFPTKRYFNGGDFTNTAKSYGSDFANQGLQLAKETDGGDFMDVGQAAGQGASIGMNPALMAATGGLSAPVGAVAGALGSVSGKLANRYGQTKFGKSKLGTAAAFAINPLFGVQNLIWKKRRKDAEKAAIKEQARFNTEQTGMIEENTKGVLQTYNTEGNNVANFALGGNTNPNKININPKNSVDLGDGMMLFKGASHENGGIPIDTDSDMIEDAEVEGDEVYEDRGQRIYSDRLKPSEEVLNEVYNQTGFKVNGTYADIAKKLGREKGKMINTGSTASQNKEDLISDRIEKSLDLIFENQEVTKPENMKNKYKYGGSPDPITKKTKTEEVALPPEEVGFSYKIKNPDGSYTLRQLPKEGFQPTDKDVKVRETIITIPEKNNNSKNVVRMYNPLPPMHPAKKSPAFDSRRRKVIGNTSFKNRSFANGGILRQEGVPKHAGGEALGSFMGSGGGSDLLGQGMNLLSYMQNKKDLKKMKIDQKPVLQSTPRFTYSDQSSYEKNLVDKEVSNAQTKIENSSLQNKGANYAKVKAASFDVKNKINNQENNRRLGSEQNYNSILTNSNRYNSYITNQMNTDNMDRFNQKIGLDIGNRQALYSGITGNMQVSQQRQSDDLQTMLQSARQGDTESLTRFLQSNPDIAKKLKLTSLIGK